MRCAPALLAVPLAALVLAGCTGPSPSPTGSPTVTSTVDPSTTPTVTATSTVTASATPVAPGGSSSAATSAGDPNRPDGQCADAALTVAVSMPKGAAGSFDQDLVFTNTGSTSCVLRGAPGLSVVGDGDGTQLGAAAARDQSGAKIVRLAARGGQAYALFGGPELAPGTEGAKACSGGVKSGDGYRVYPPHSTRAYLVRERNAEACPTGGAFLHVGVVKAQGTS